MNYKYVIAQKFITGVHVRYVIMCRHARIRNKGKLRKSSGIFKSQRLPHDTYYFLLFQMPFSHTSFAPITHVVQHTLEANKTHSYNWLFILMTFSTVSLTSIKHFETVCSSLVKGLAN